MIASSFFIPGPEGELEAVLDWPKTMAPETSDPATIAVVCHPHPAHGGTFTNKVVTTLARSMVSENMPALRFNFRGVGKSQGQFGGGVGEVEDLRAVLTWVQSTYPKATILLAGFSFGAYVSLRLASEALTPPTAPEFSITHLVSVAPPVYADYFKVQQPIPIPWLILMGEQDEIVPFEQVVHWREQFAPEASFVTFPQTGHFFHGKLIELKEALLRWFRDTP